MVETLFLSPSIAATIRSSLPREAVNVSTLMPSLKTVARSQISSISAKRCDIKMTDFPLFFCEFIIEITFSAKSTGSAAVISSNINSSGSCDKARAKSIILSSGSSIFAATSFKFTFNPIADNSVVNLFSSVPVKARLRWIDRSGIRAGS